MSEEKKGRESDNDNSEFDSDEEEMEIKSPKFKENSGMYRYFF